MGIAIDRLPKSLRKYADRIDSVEDLRDTDEGYWIHLIEGWRDYEGETHTINEPTLRESAKCLGWAQPCHGGPDCCSAASVAKALASVK